jgi:hypothetical protein
LTLEELSANYHLPINDVAAKVSDSLFCRFVVFVCAWLSLADTDSSLSPTLRHAARAVRHRSEATLPRTRHHSVAVSEGALALVLVYNFDPTRRRFLLTPLKLTLSPGRRTGSTVIFDTHVEQENFFNSSSNTTTGWM